MPDFSDIEFPCQSIICTNTVSDAYDYAYMYDYEYILKEMYLFH